MKDIFATIWQAASTSLGLLVLAAIVWWVAKAHSYMWRSVCAEYPTRTPLPLDRTKRLETIVITRRGASGPILSGYTEYRQYAGAIMSVDGGSLTVSLLSPFTLLCPPLDLPLDQMELRQADWALWPEPYALRMRKLPNIDIIVGRDTVAWLRIQTGLSPFDASL